MDDKRRFLLSDVIVLLLPTAVAAATLRQGPNTLAFLKREGVGVTFNLGDWGQALEFGLALCGPGLAAFTMTLLALRLRRPRPVRSRLWRQPGVAALLSAAMVLSVEAVASAVILWLSDWPALEDLLWNHSAPLLQMAGAAVLGAWVTLVASGRWKAERSWIDRAGRAVGFVWIVVFLMALGLHYYSEITGFLPLAQWFQKMAAQQEKQRNMFEGHQERQRQRIARFDDLHELRKFFLAKESAEQVDAIDQLLDEWHERENREIAEEQKERDEFNRVSQLPRPSQ